MNVKKSIIQIHLLLGLFIFPYLLIFGITSLNFNHGFWNSYAFRDVKEETFIIQIPDISNELDLINALKDSLHIFGWTNQRATHLDSGILYSKINHPGKAYELKVNSIDNSIRLKTSRKTFIGILAGLHTLGEVIPSSPWWVASWKYYQLLSVCSIIFWIISGLYLWMISKHRKRLETYVLIGFTAFAFLLMIWLWQG